MCKIIIKKYIAHKSPEPLNLYIVINVNNDKFLNVYSFLWESFYDIFLNTQLN